MHALLQQTKLAWWHSHSLLYMRSWVQIPSLYKSKLFFISSLNTVLHQPRTKSKISILSQSVVASY